MTASPSVGIAPYVGILLFIAGMAVRYAITRKDIHHCALSISDVRNLFGRAMLFRISLFLLLLGHLVGLVFPQWIVQWNGTAFRLYALEGVAFALGLLAFGGWAVAMWQHIRRSDAPVAKQAADAVFLPLLFTALASGSLTAIFFRWGSSWGVLTLTPYARSLLRGRPAVGLITGMPFLVRLHVFAAFASLAVLPVIPAAHVLLVAMDRSMRFVLTLIRMAVNPAYGLIALAIRRLNPGAWIWPEEG